MLRMHRFDEPYSIRLRIEGVLTVEAVAGLDRAWEELVSGAQGRKLRIDASALKADAAGIAWLARVENRGAKVDDAGRFLPRRRAAARPWLRRIRHGLCAAVCAALPISHRCPCSQRV